MSMNPQKQGALINNSSAVGTVTSKIVQERARELSIINGRSSGDILKSDFEQAKRELTGEPEVDPKTAVLESAPESQRWDSLPGSTGHKVPPAPSEDEDDEGRSDNAKLVEEGIAEAEHDQMLQASKDAAKEK